jgi:predicted nucleic acid-binding protein
VITFIDSGVLITAWKGKERLKALAILSDESRTFVSSQLVRLEVLPKARYHKQQFELALYDEHFRIVTREEPLSASLAEDALELASKYGLAAADALNLAAAIRLGASQFITTEQRTKPMFRVTEIEVISVS